MKKHLANIKSKNGNKKEVMMKKHSENMMMDKLTDAKRSMKEAKTTAVIAERRLFKAHYEAGHTTRRAQAAVKHISTSNNRLKESIKEKNTNRMDFIESKQAGDKQATRVRDLPEEMKDYKDLEIFNIVPESREDTWNRALCHLQKFFNQNLSPKIG